MGQWYVYLLRCSDDSLYCGVTNDLPARLVAHSKGRGSKYVRSRLPAMLVWSKEMPSGQEALRVESAIKKLPKHLKEQMATNEPQIMFRVNEIMTKRKAARRKSKPIEFGE